MLRTLRRIAERPATDHEAIFLERYQRLYDRARRLTQDPEQAADLVQDAFVQWALSRTPLDAIQNLDAYLFTMLAHLHVSQVRRAVRARQVHLDPLEHDSAEFALRGADALSRLQTAEELRRICEFACNRRLTSRTGSVLLLRFFHGYYTREIASILRVPTANVDGFLHLARREARTSLSEPASNRAQPRPAANGHASSVRDDCLRDLRASIFALAHDRCFSPECLKALYDAPPDDLPSCQVLAEIVTCPACLDAVNELLDLPPLSDRHPTDSIGPSHRSGPPRDGTGGGGAPAGTASRLRRHASDVLEHRPSELSVLVNGFFVASHRVSGPRTAQSVRLGIGEDVRFVEVFSEQDVRLALAVVQAPPEGPLEQKAAISLSDDRHLELDLSFAEQQPVVHLRYRDPSYRSVAAIEGAIEPAAVSEEGGADAAPSPAHDDASAGPAWWTWLTGWGLRPLVASSAVLLLIAAAWWWSSLVAPSRVSVSEILTRADAADRAAWHVPGSVEHQVFDVEERRVDAGVVVERMQVEVWRRPGDGAIARRVLDATTWALRASEVSHAGEAPPDVPRLIDAGEIWRLEPSAAHFVHLSQGLSEPVVELTEAAYVLRAEADVRRTNRGVMRLVMALARDGLRPVAQTLVVNGPSGLREYRFTRRSIERVPLEGSEGYFAPVTSPGSADDVVAPGGSSRREAPALSPAEIADLHVSALSLLDSVGATLGDQIAVKPGASGIAIHGILDTPARRRDIMRALAPMVGNPSVTIHLRTSHEAIREGTSRHAASADRGVEASGDRPSAYDEVRRVITADPSRAWPVDADAREARIERAVREFGAGVLATSRQALQHAWALYRLIEQVPPEVVPTLSGNAREKWRSMIREHARALGRDLTSVHEALQPVFAAASPRHERAATSAVPLSAVSVSVSALLAHARTQDEAVRASFVVTTTDTTPAIDVTTPAFWESLRRAQDIAERLAHVE
jgi:RNA polymerase sigma factor (sigma-70 family)